MQVLKEEIRQRIYSSALKVFYQKGYLSASIKEIASEAVIPAGLIYSYYKNKEALLEDIVGDIYLKAPLFLKSHEPTFDGTSVFLDIEIPQILELLNKKHQEMVILIDKCSGTKYEDAKANIVNLAAAHIKEHYLKTRPDIVELIDDLFYHIQASGFCEGIFELARHYKDETWAKNMLFLLARHKLYGSKGL
jgi:AcrR family transcriptional regulator